VLYLETEGRRQLALERAAGLEDDYRRSQRAPRPAPRFTETAKVSDRLRSILRPRRPLIRTPEEDRPCAA